MEEKGNSWYSAEHNGSAPANEQEQGSQQQGVGCATLMQDAALTTETSHNPQEQTLTAHPKHSELPSGPCPER